MGRTKAYIHVPGSSADFKGHADDILPSHVPTPLEKILTGEIYWVHRAPASCLPHIRKANPATMTVEWRHATAPLVVST